VIMLIDHYTNELVDMEAIEEASQDYLRILDENDLTSHWSRNFPVQYPAQGP
jgi:hypothetical protein